MQALTSLMEFLGKEIQKYPSIPTRINAVSIWSGMEFDMSSPFQNHTKNIRSGIFFCISLDFPWNKWNAMYRVFRNSLRYISMLFRTLLGQECTAGVIYQILFFRRYWHWCRWHQEDIRSLSPPWLHFSLNFVMLCKILLLIWRVLN